jgi:BASS family bile acid:Na+ symporter
MSIDRVINLLATLTLLEMMITIGLGVTFADVAGVGRNLRLLAKAGLANYIIFPAAALGLVLLFRANPLVAVGFLIPAVCPGAPYTPPFTKIARGNVPRAVGLMTILAGSSALLAPILLRFLLPLVSGDTNVQIDALRLLSTLLFTQLLPLCVGLGIRQWRPALGDRLIRPASRLSLILNLAFLTVLMSAQWKMLIAIPLRGYLGMLLMVLVGLAAGLLLGGPGIENRTALTMATAVRNVGVSMVIAAGSFAGTKAVTAATAFAFFQTIVVALVAIGWGKLASPKAAVPAIAPKTSQQAGKRQQDDRRDRLAG